MPKIDLARAKLHLRVDGSAEDALITAWVEAAYLAVEGKVFRKVYDTEGDIPEADKTGIATNEAINAAVLLILGHLYVNREAVTPGQVAVVPMGAEWLLVPYINTGEGF